MEPRLASVRAGPFRFRSDEADAGAGGVVVDFPSGGEEAVDVFVEEEVGRAVRSVEHADFPIAGVGDGRRKRKADGNVRVTPDTDHIAGEKRAAAVATE